MTIATLKKTLNSGRISKDQRDFLVDTILFHPALVETLWEEVLLEDKNNTFNASWVLDNVLRKDLRLLLPHLDKFCGALAHLQSDSVIRPVAHICEMLVLCYFKKKSPDCLKYLKKPHLEAITEVCFDWLISEYKVATKSFRHDLALLFRGSILIGYAPN